MTGSQQGGQSNPARQPKGIPTGGQFAASAREEAEVGLSQAVEAEVSPDAVDDEDASYQDDDDWFGDSEELFEFEIPGSSSTYQVRLLDDGEEGAEYELYRDGTYVGEVAYLGDPEAHDAIEEAARERLKKMDPAAQIADPEVRAACEEYAARYALGPTDSAYEPDWAESLRLTAAEVTVGSRLFNGQVVTRVDTTTRPGQVLLHVDGDDEPGAAGLHWYGPDDNVKVHPDRVDLSDPDWFEVEARRALRHAVLHEENLSGGTYSPSTERRAEIEAEIRERLYRSYSRTDISPMSSASNMDPRTAMGRAKVGDDVIFTQPMHGDSSYRVIGKRARVDVSGHDGTAVTWAETGEVDYVLADTTTGVQTTSNLRSHGWRRLPAPGDNGPGAQAQRLR